jgi:hypothetical protein
MQRLRTELWTAPVLRLRALGPMLKPPAGELRPPFRAFGPDDGLKLLRLAHQLCVRSR